MKRLAIITTHPIQYNAPLFRWLNEHGAVQVKVFYTWEQAKTQVFDPGFGRERQWDIPLLDGYEYEFVKNSSSQPGSHHYKGIINPDLIQCVKAYDPEAILVFGWSFQSHLKLMRHFKGKKKILFRGDSNLLDQPADFSFKKLARRILLTWVYRNVDVALYTGSANKNYYLKYGLKPSQLAFAPHAVDNKRFIAAALPGNKVQDKRAEFDIPIDAIVFLFAGKLEPKKDPQLLLDAFIKLETRDAHLLFVGDGILETSLKKNVAKQPEYISRRIHFLSFQNQQSMPAVYHAGDVFCLPSQGPGETWGLAVNEAMACSKPVLVSDKCGCYLDLIKDNENGFVVKNKDVNDWYEKMKGMLENKSRLADMGNRSLYIIQQWGYEKTGAAIEAASVS